MKKELNRILDELDLKGRVSPSSYALVSRELEAHDCFDAISVAADCRLIGLASKIAEKVTHADQMVRWMAICTLLGRFELETYVALGLELAERDESLMVRGAALTRLGSVLPLVKDQHTAGLIAAYLLGVVENHAEVAAMRQDAYDGIKAAMAGEEEIKPVSLDFNPTEDIDPVVVSRFAERFMNDV